MSYYYHDTIGGFIIRSGWLFELLGGLHRKILIIQRPRNSVFSKTLKIKGPPLSTELEALFTKRNLTL